jgi:hypothetical protein
MARIEISMNVMCDAMLDELQLPRSTYYVMGDADIAVTVTFSLVHMLYRLITFPAIALDM